MIDICTIVYKNYDILKIQINHWRDSVNAKDYRLLICDNTPREERCNIEEIREVLDSNEEVFELDIEGIDGETHAAALHFLINQTSSNIIGIQDSDFFWLRPNIISWVKSEFNLGCKCLGAAGYYPDWQSKLDIKWPERAGNLAPVCYGMFIDRQIALNSNFNVSQSEALEIKETGWRVRKYLIESNIQRTTIPGFKYDNQQDPENCFFGYPPEPAIAVHILKGSFGRLLNYNEIRTMISEETNKWIIQ